MIELSSLTLPREIDDIGYSYLMASGDALLSVGAFQIQLPGFKALTPLVAMATAERNQWFLRRKLDEIARLSIPSSTQKGIQLISSLIDAAKKLNPSNSSVQQLLTPQVGANHSGLYAYQDLHYLFLSGSPVLFNSDDRSEAITPLNEFGHSPINQTPTMSLLANAALAYARDILTV